MKHTSINKEQEEKINTVIQNLSISSAESEKSSSNVVASTATKFNMRKQTKKVNVWNEYERPESCRFGDRRP